MTKVRYYCFPKFDPHKRQLCAKSMLRFLYISPCYVCMLVFSRSCEISTLVELFNIEFYRGKSPRFDLAINGHEDKRSLSITESRVTINIEQIINIVDLRKIFFSIKNLDLNFYRFFFLMKRQDMSWGFTFHQIIYGEDLNVSFFRIHQNSISNVFECLNISVSDAMSNKRPILHRFFVTFRNNLTHGSRYGYGYPAI